MQNFVYFIGDPETRSLAVVDPAWDPDGVLAVAQENGYEITHVLVTHYHPDHLGGRMMGMEVTGAQELLARGVKAKVHIHKAEGPYVDRVTDLAKSDLVEVDDGDSIHVGNVPVKFLHTPGHTPGSQCFLVGDSVIAGDTMFIGACGRVDLPGSNPEDMYDSLTRRLASLPEHTKLYPGHNYAASTVSTIGDEKQTNPYLRFPDVQSFLRVMGVPGTGLT